RPGLAQEIVWDGKDDFGKPAEGGPFSFRVRAGTRLAFGRTLAGSPYMIDTIRGLASDSQGNLYILHHPSNSGPPTVQVYSDMGEYIRTVFPPAADISLERLGDLVYRDGEKRRIIPRNYNDIYPRFLPYFHKAAESIGMVPVVSESSGILLHTGQWVFRLDTDGSTGGRLLRYSFLYPIGLSPYDAAATEVFTAALPDGSRLFACGPCSKPDASGKPFNPNWPAGRICAMGIGEDQYMKPLADVALPPGWAARGGPPLAGVAADARGRLYVCDRAADRVVVLDPSGRETASVPVRDPYRIAVHPSDGAIYVLTRRTEARGRNRYALLKLAGPAGDKPTIETDLGYGRNAGAFMVLTAKDGRTGVWVAAMHGNISRLDRGDVTRFEEKDGAFVATVKFHEKDPDALGLFDVIAADPFTEDVYINDDYSGMYRYNGLTGEGGSLQKVRKDFWATEIAVGPDGYLYARTGPSYSGPLERLDRDLKPVPLAPGGTHMFTDYIYSRFGAGHAEKGVAVGLRGQVYVMNMYDWQRYAVYGLNPDGSFMEGKYLKGRLVAYADRKGKKPDSAVIGPVPDACGGLRVDTKGNIYVGMLMLPPGYKGPSVLAADPSWRSLVGSIIRFGPEGGEWVCTDPRLARSAPKGIRTEIPEGASGVHMENGHFLLGASMVYPEFAPFSGAAGTGELGRPPIGRENCACRSPRFDIDRFDRLYVPNAVT
ncbi:MAG: hypothetical protein N3A38_15750, partial [Planctomycetota bacterium]|nr:hypothetical protein [Planctomycetota bacterium]